MATDAMACGQVGGACCATGTACAPFFGKATVECQNAVCVPCGLAGEPCCATTPACANPDGLLNDGVICYQATCQTCGTPGGPCCPFMLTCPNSLMIYMGACGPGFTCTGETCAPCGTPGFQCCYDPYAPGLGGPYGPCGTPSCTESTCQPNDMCEWPAGVDRSKSATASVVDNEDSNGRQLPPRRVCVQVHGTPFNDFNTVGASHKAGFSSSDSERGFAHGRIVWRLRARCAESASRAQPPRRQRRPETKLALDRCAHLWPKAIALGGESSTPLAFHGEEPRCLLSDQSHPFERFPSRRTGKVDGPGPKKRVPGARPHEGGSLGRASAWSHRASTKDSTWKRHFGRFCFRTTRTSSTSSSTAAVPTGP